MFGHNCEIAVSKIFFSSNLVGRTFFSLPNALQDFFFSPHFSVGFFFLKKVSCLHLQNVITFTLVIGYSFNMSCKKRMMFSLYWMSIGH